MMFHEGNAPKSDSVQGMVREKGSKEGSCCQESLTNAHPDLNSKINVITIDRPQLQLANESQINRNKILDGSPNEHDPPDLQISFSSLLL